MDELTRIDPSGCGCTDCILGYSKPIDCCIDNELLLLHLGILENASRCKTTVEINIKYDYEQ